MKKIGLWLVAVVLVLGIASGCSSANNGGTNQGGANTQTGNDETPKKQVNLVFSIWGNETHKQMYEDLLVDFKTTHDHINVEIQTIPFDDYQQKLSIMAASQTAPDVAWLAERMIPQFLESGQLLDISTNVKADSAYNFADVFPSTLELFTNGDALYGIPFSTPPGVMFYNKTLFEQHGLKTPLELVAEGNWTYDEFLHAANTIADPDQGVYGVKLIREWKNWSDALLPLFWSHGADVFNEDGTAFTLNTPEGAAALQLFNDMIFIDNVHPKPGDAITFETGKIGMFTDRYSYVSTARAIEDFEWDIAPMPAGTHGRGTSMGFAGYSVFDTDHPEEAMELLKFLTNESSMAVTSQFFVPSRKSILESDVFIDAGELPGAESIHIAILDQMGEARIAPGHQNWQQIDVKMQTLMDYIYTQTDSVEDVLQKMEDEINPLMN